MTGLLVLANLPGGHHLRQALLRKGAAPAGQRRRASRPEPCEKSASSDAHMITSRNFVPGP